MDALVVQHIMKGRSTAFEWKKSTGLLFAFKCIVVWLRQANVNTPLLLQLIQNAYQLITPKESLSFQFWLCGWSHVNNINMPQMMVFHSRSMECRACTGNLWLWFRWGMEGWVFCLGVYFMGIFVGTLWPVATPPPPHDSFCTSGRFCKVYIVLFNDLFLQILLYWFYFFLMRLSFILLNEFFCCNCIWSSLVDWSSKLVGPRKNFILLIFHCCGVKKSFHCCWL